MLKRKLLASLSVVVFSAFVSFAHLPSAIIAAPTNDRSLMSSCVALAIPNVASDHQNIRRNAEFILAMMQRRGLNPRLLETATKASPPAVYGE